MQCFLAVSGKAKHRHALEHSNSTPTHAYIYTKKDINKNLQSDDIHNNPKLETTQMSVRSKVGR